MASAISTDAAQAPIADTSMDIDMDLDLDLGPEPEAEPELQPSEAVSITRTIQVARPPILM